jgi:hypothetical protein
MVVAPEGRLVVHLISYKGAWVTRQVGTGDDSEVYFLRKSSMRMKSQWAALLVGSHVSLVIKRVSGRGIVSDAMLC